MSAENPYAGQGAVLLDIGGDVGALVVLMPLDLVAEEVEARVKGPAPDHAHPHGHPSRHGHPHSHDHAHLPHVAVVARPLGGRLVPSLVFPELQQGEYELYLRPAGPVQLVVTVRGGEVSHATWP